MDLDSNPKRSEDPLTWARYLLEGSSTEQDPRHRLNNRVLPTKFRYLFLSKSERQLHQVIEQLKAEPFLPSEITKGEEDLFLLNVDREEMHTPESLAERIKQLQLVALTAGAHLQKCIPMRFQLRLGKSIPHHLKNEPPAASDEQNPIAI